jgi:hypothetical protein
VAVERPALSRGRVKGTIMVEVVKYLRSRKEAARDVVPPSLHRYLDTRILSTSWHPEEDYLELMRALVKIRPTTDATPGVSPWEAAARASNAAYVEGPYKVLLRPGDPAQTLANFGALWRLRHDTGDIRVVPEGDTAARLELRDYALVAREACELIQGTIWSVLHHAGAEKLRVEQVRCRARGDEACVWHVSWS